MNIKEGQPLQHDAIKRVGKMGRITLAASLLAGGASLVPANVDINVTSNDAEGTSCVPYTTKLLTKRSTPYSITARRAILVGDNEISNKGLRPDNKRNSKQISIINLPSRQTQKGIYSKYGDTYVEIFNSCATTTQFRAEIGRLELLNLPNGDAESSVDTHKITTTAAEPHVDPVPTCNPILTPIDIPPTGENGTTAIRNIKRAILTVDANVQNAKFDNNENTGETIIIDFPTVSDLVNVNAPWGGSGVVMTDCASTKDFNATIGEIQKIQAGVYPEGQQTFYINTP